jgi:uncharacterized protein YcfL
MKKILLVLVATLLLAGCGTAETKTKVSKQDVGEVKTMATAEINEERTVDFQGEAPWIRNSAIRLQQLVDDGETVHLWSDAEAFEAKVLTLIDYVPPKSNAVNAPDPKDEIAKAHNSTNEHIKVFVGELSKRHPDKKEYFDKLSDVGAVLVTGDIEEAKSKLQEAKSLRAE